MLTICDIFETIVSAFRWIQLESYTGHAAEFFYQPDDRCHDMPCGSEQTRPELCVAALRRFGVGPSPFGAYVRVSDVAYGGVPGVVYRLPVYYVGFWDRKRSC